MMKRTFLFFILLTIMGLGVGCGGMELPDENEVDPKKQLTLSVSTRTISGEALAYPLSVGAFNGEGRCVAQQSVASAETPIKLSLPAGTYRLIAMSGAESKMFSSAEKATLSDGLSLSEPNCATPHAIMRGEANVSLSAGNAKANLLMNPATASVSITLSDVPQEVTAVSVRLHPVFSQLSWGNQYSAPKSATLVCQKTASGTWTTQTQFLFPSSENYTSLTLALTTAHETQHYGYTLTAPLKTATPYVLRGQFSTSGGIGMDAEILSMGWNASVDQHFSFGPAAGIPIEHGETPSAPSSENIASEEMPKAGTLWNGYAVAYVEPISEQEVVVLLISKDEWFGLSSAHSSTQPDQAAEIAATYSEGRFSDWHIPTRDEARFLSDTYRDDALEDFNELMESAGGAPLLAKENDKNVRYLCEAAFYTYDYRGGSILAAGKTVKNYRLRLVKNVRVTLK